VFAAERRRFAPRSGKRERLRRTCAYFDVVASGAPARQQNAELSVGATMPAASVPVRHGGSFRDPWKMDGVTSRCVLGCGRANRADDDSALRAPAFPHRSERAPARHTKCGAGALQRNFRPCFPREMRSERAVH